MRSGKVDWRPLATSLALALVVSVLAPRTVLADHTANCDPDLNPKVFASFSTDGNRQGARAVFDAVPTLDLCTNPIPNDKAQTFAFAAVGGVSDLDIVQWGLGRCRDPNNSFYCNGTLGDIYAYGRDNSTPGCSGFLDKLPIPIRLAGTPGWGEDFRLQRVGNFWNLYQDATLRISIAAGQVCWTTTEALWFFEVMDTGDALGGTSGNHYRLTTLRYLPAIGAGWNTIKPADCEAAFDPEFPYNCDGGGPGASWLEAWTDRL